MLKQLHYIAVLATDALALFDVAIKGPFERVTFVQDMPTVCKKCRWYMYVAVMFYQGKVA